MNYFTVIFILCCAAVANGARRNSGEYGTSGGSSSGSSTEGDLFFQGEKHIKFKVYNHNDLLNPYGLKFNSTINPTWVNNTWKTIVFIHGWRGGQRMQEVMTKAYLLESENKVNLIEVDWLSGAHSLIYCPSARRVPNVGETVAKFIGLNQRLFNLNRLIITGHSLGAHAAGFAGKFLHSIYKFKPRAVVGLDPAGPLFRGDNPKLQPTDAQDVVVIHTSEKFGHMEPLGTLDVYINGGKTQPGCSDAQSHGFSKLIYKELAVGTVPLIGHIYKSYDDVKSDRIPQSDGIKLFHGADLPPHGTLAYLSTAEQPYLIKEVIEYIDSKLYPASDECCTIM